MGPTVHLIAGTFCLATFLYEADLFADWLACEDAQKNHPAFGFLSGGSAVVFFALGLVNFYLFMRS